MNGNARTADFVDKKIQYILCMGATGCYPFKRQQIYLHSMHTGNYKIVKKYCA